MVAEDSHRYIFQIRRCPVADTRHVCVNASLRCRIQIPVKSSLVLSVKLLTPDQFEQGL